MPLQHTLVLSRTALSLTLAAVAGCSDAESRPTAPRATLPKTVVAGGASHGAAAEQRAEGPSALGTIPLPIDQTYTGSATALKITHTGTSGAVANFVSTGASNTTTALVVAKGGTGKAISASQTGGSGNAGTFANTFTTNASAALYVTHAGPGPAIEAWGTTGHAAKFYSLGQPTVPIVYMEGNGTSNSGGPVLHVRQKGAAAYAIRATLDGNTNGNGSALFAEATGTSGYAGLFTASNASHFSDVVQIANSGTGSGLFVFQNNQSATGDAIVVTNRGSGWAGAFYGNSYPTSKGVYIETIGGAGLQVVGGSKNAVVGTMSGARALYTEESAEVWFTDYGMGRLTSGRVHVSFDPVFRETIALQPGYHVFVQSYGDADLMVKNRTSGGFDVVRRGGVEDAEFSYRIVARRKGFESKRLERAPWADKAVARKRVN